MPVQLVCLLFHSLQNYLRLLSHAHQDDAFHGFVLPHVPELPKPHRVADLHFRDVMHIDRNAIVHRQHDISYIRRISNQSESANIIDLAAL